MQIRSAEIPDVKIVEPVRHGDHRGFFSETWSRGAFASGGIANDWVQDNHSVSRAAGVIRGLHFQTPPFAQAKLVRVARGAIYDVAVDIRRGSPTFGRHVAVTLSAEAWNQLFVPAGFAHGFMTLVPDCEVLYKVDAPYSAANDRGLLWSDLALDIAWPLDGLDPILSDRDTRHPRLADLASDFVYEPR
jgi:dTDP-4-dehydrorhamnose 3,5-epimerase